MLTVLVSTSQKRAWEFFAEVVDETLHNGLRVCVKPLIKRPEIMLSNAQACRRVTDSSCGWANQHQLMAPKEMPIELAITKTHNRPAFDS